MRGSKILRANKERRGHDENETKKNEMTEIVCIEKKSRERERKEK